MRELVVELSKFKPVRERRVGARVPERWDWGLMHSGVSVESEPYTIAFCYLPKLCLVVKGLHSEVHTFVDNLPACSYYLSMWKQGKHRGFWKLNAKAEKRFWLQPRVDDNSGRHKYVLLRRPDCVAVAEMRRVPRAYLKELAE